MPQIKGPQFVQSLSTVSLGVAELQGAARLRGVDLVTADLNRDGKIQGTGEARALWQGLSAVEMAREDSHRWLWPFGRPRQNGVEERLAAVDSFRMAELRSMQAKSQGDAFHRAGKLKHGPAAGEPLNTEKARPVVVLDETQRLDACRRAGVDPQSIALGFANLRHDGAFHIALLPHGAVADVFLMLESFPAPVPAAHTMLRFALHDDKPAILVPQNTDPTPATLSLPDLVFSAEALGQPGSQYDLLAGQRGHFGLVDRIESLEDRFAHVESYDPPHPVTLYRLPLSDERKQNILQAAIVRSDARGLEATYNTLFRSCAIEAFEVLDRGIGNDVSPWVHAGRILADERIPTMGSQALRLRGLLTDETPTSLRDEMQRSPRRAQVR